VNLETLFPTRILMKMLIRATNDDGSGFEVEIEEHGKCSVQVRPAAPKATITHVGGPDAAAIAEAEAVFAHLRPENGG
jgi:hypothetical protein